MSRTQRTADRYYWRNYSEEKLLDLRICDLNLQLKRSPISPWLKIFEKEIKDRGFRFKPHFWLSEEFFTPDSVPGIAIPFYLAHPRLEQLEKKHLFEAEGNNQRWFLKIMRHELGHAIEHAYFLHRRKDRQRIFGKSSVKYPEFYTPKAYSRSYVVHLENWYAQAHPDEDFAETFAVWFTPQSQWRKKYNKWPALKKLIYVDRLMAEVRDLAPKNRSKAKSDPVEKIKKTLREYLTEKKERFGLNTQEDFYDRELKRLFVEASVANAGLKASRFLRKHRKEIRSRVSFWTGQYQYNVNEVLDELIERVDELDLRLKTDEEKAKADFLVLFTVQIMNTTHNGGYQLAL